MRGVTFYCYLHLRSFSVALWEYRDKPASFNRDHAEPVLLHKSRVFKTSTGTLRRDTCKEVTWRPYIHFSELDTLEFNEQELLETGYEFVAPFNTGHHGTVDRIADYFTGVIKAVDAVTDHPEKVPLRRQRFGNQESTQRLVDLMIRAKIGLGRIDLPPLPSHLKLFVGANGPSRYDFWETSARIP